MTVDYAPNQGHRLDVGAARSLFGYGKSFSESS